MEIDELFQKLRPVLGRKVDALWLDYQLNPESRREIEGILRALASKHLGASYKQKEVLLVAPPCLLADGQYRLGKVHYGPIEPFDFGLRESEFIQHIGIFGRTGSGKTNVGFLLVKQLLEKKKPWVVFDWKRNYRDLLALADPGSIKVFTVGRDIAPFQFNPLIPPKGTKPTIWLKKLIEIMCHVYWLGEGVAYLLQKAIDQVYDQFDVYEKEPGAWPTMAHVKQWLEQYKAKGREAQWMDSTIRVLGTLCYGEIGRVVNITQPAPVDQLLRENVVLELDALTNSDKTFLIESLLLWIHHYRLQDELRETFKHAILIEEAHHVLLRGKESKESIMDVIVREIRELGESLIIIDQHPSLISIPSLGNTYCTIAMNLKHSRDVNAIGDAILLDTKDRDFLGQLDPGVGIVKLQGRWHKPFLVRFPLVEVKKGSVSDHELRKQMAGVSAPAQVILPDRVVREEILLIRQQDKIVEDQYETSEEEERMLIDVMEHPTSGIADRYKRLCWSVHRGSVLLSSLLDRSFLCSSFVRTPSGRVRYIWLSDHGKAALRQKGHTVNDAKAGGPEHEYWKQKVAEHFRSQGYQVELEKPLASGHVVDAVATKGDERILVEVETGKSDALANVQRCLGEQPTKVIVLALEHSNLALQEKFKNGKVEIWTNLMLH